MAPLPEPHAEYEFLKVHSNGEIIYEALEGGHFMEFLELIRNHPEVVEPVTQVILHVEYDSADNSGARWFIEDYNVQVDKGTGVLGTDAFESSAESAGANTDTSGENHSTSHPAANAAPAPVVTADPFQRAADNFAIVCQVANIDKDEDLETQLYLNLVADLLSVGLPNLGTLVMPKEWIDNFDTTPLRKLGVVVPR